MSSVRPSVCDLFEIGYFSAPMALRELKFGSHIRWFDALNSREFWIHNLGVQESGHDQDPDQEK
jgi:hypothetical protein